MRRRRRIRRFYQIRSPNIRDRRFPSSGNRGLVFGMASLPVGVCVVLEIVFEIGN